MNASMLRAKFFYADSAASQRHPRQTDVELLQALKEHTDPALRLVIDRHGSAVVGLARKVLGDEGLAQDVAEAVFVQPRSFHCHPQNDARLSWPTTAATRTAKSRGSLDCRKVPSKRRFVVVSVA